jgi:hypothetical protein
MKAKNWDCTGYIVRRLKRDTPEVAAEFGEGSLLTPC